MSHISPAPQVGPTARHAPDRARFRRKTERRAASLPGGYRERAGTERGSAARSRDDFGRFFTFLTCDRSLSRKEAEPPIGLSALPPRTVAGNRPRALLVPCLLAAASIATATLAAQAPQAPASSQLRDPWALLEHLRASLAADAPLKAHFTQSFVPAGFSSGETESGTFSLALPDCLRWDYAEPDPKSFLICGQSGYAWNQGETTGRFLHIAARDEPGLDLLLLPTTELEHRYGASSKAGTNGRQEIWLAPIDPTKNALVSATLELDAAGDRLLAIAYSDREGNRTRFDLTSYEPLRASDRDVFAPPESIRWQEE